HWDGEFDDAGALSDATIRALMVGDALLVDTDASAAWMREAPIPVGRAAEDAGDAARIERGADVFARAGCDACHAGELFADGAVHDVVPRSSDDAAALGMVSTPSLRGVRARAPFLHDGRAPTLRAMLDEANEENRHGDTAALTEDERADLVRYLESL
ncbi:MAG: c-type cytochrome, partial [Sandaracinaceae bacterium]